MRFISLGMLLITSAANASIVTIDFEPGTYENTIPYSYDESGQCLCQVTSQGYLITGLNGTDGTSPSGSTGYLVGPTDPVANNLITLETLSGESFDIFSAYGATPFAGSAEWVITGYYSAGGTVSLTEAFSSEQTFSFDSSWQGLQKVTFAVYDPSNNGSVLDTLVVSSAVPVPAAVWLFGSALAGLGWLRRKQAA